MYWEIKKIVTHFISTSTSLWRSETEHVLSPLSMPEVVLEEDSELQISRQSWLTPDFRLVRS